MWINMCLRGDCVFTFISISSLFKGHNLWGSRQESRNVQSSPYPWNYVQVSIIFFFFLALSILQIQAKSNSLPFNKFWHSWCDAAIQTVLWSFSKPQRDAVNSNFDRIQLWYEYASEKMNWLSFSVKGNWIYNKRVSDTVHKLCFLIPSLFIFLFQELYVII